MPANPAFTPGVRMKRALPLLASLAACSLREPRVSSASCTSAGQCARGDVCFLGECRPPSANLSVVRAEVRPPAGSQFGLKDAQIDLRQSVLNDFTLAVPLSIGTAAGSVRGTVTQAQDGAPAVPVPGTIVIFSDHAPLIPDRIEQMASVTDLTGDYSARIPQGTWDVQLQPAAPLPPLRFGTLDTASPVTNYIIPPTSTLARLDGSLSYADAGTPPVVGASVTAVDPQGTALSASTITQADGGYSLYLAPNSSQLALQIGPPTDAGVASGLPDPFPTYPGVAYAPTVNLSLPDVATLSGRILDPTGTPIPGTRVYVRSSNMGWMLSRSVVSDATGAYSVALRQGTYLVQAAPSTDPTSPALSAVQSVALPAPALDLTCPFKVKRSGVVLGPDGRPVGGNFQIVATRVSDGLVATRTADTVSTDPGGGYQIIADAGRWRFEVTPPASSTLPRKIVQVNLDGTIPNDTLPAIQISSPLEVVGTVKGAAPGVPATAVPDAIVSFFSLDSTGSSVFLGSARTDAQGRYTAILPDAQPGGGP